MVPAGCPARPPAQDRQIGISRTGHCAGPQLIQAWAALAGHQEFVERYDEYLAKGYPIGTGVVEGACRHFVDGYAGVDCELAVLVRQGARGLRLGIAGR